MDKHRICGRFLMGSIVVAGMVSGAAPDGTNTMSEIVVTATRSEQSRTDIPASVSVLSEADVRAVAARNVDDLVRTLDGVTILQSVGMGYGLPSQVNIRGVPGQHGVLMLVDGMPVNEARGGFLNMNEVPLSAVRQIEVVRGAFSSLYGTDAFSGVINVLTQDPGAGPAAEASGAMGNEGYHDAGLRVSAGDRRLGFVVTAGKRSMDNYLARHHVTEQAWNPATMQMVDVSRPAENYDYADERVLGKFLMELGPNANLAVQARYFDGELGYGQKELAPVYPVPVDDVIESRSLFLGASLQARAGDRTDWNLQACHRWQERDTFGLDLSHYVGVFPVYVRSKSESDSRDWKIDGGVSHRVTDSQKVLVGADYSEGRCEFSAVRNRETGQALPASASKTANVNNTGVYAQDEVDVGADWKVIGGVRMDANSEFDPAWSPRLGLRYRFGADTVGRASVGQAYRAPTVLELHQPAIAFGNTLFQSNPDLDPEYITTFDAGVDSRLSKSLRGHVDGFYNAMKDLIDTAVTASGLTYMNTDKGWSAGAHAGVDWEWLPGLTLVVNYTYQQTEDEATGRDLSLMPEHAANAGVRAHRTMGSWTVEGSVMENYVGERGYADLATGGWATLDDYWRTDISARVGVGENLWVGGSVQNATGERYQEWQLINPAPGRIYAVELGLRYW